MLKIILLLLITTAVKAIPGVSDGALFTIASNTLNSVRELNSILTEQRQFSESFERVYSKVDQTVWKADRTIMWMDDIKELSESDIENIDDFNYVLSSLKEDTTYLRAKLIKHNQENKAIQNDIDKSRKNEKKSRKRSRIYAAGAKSSLSPNQAQVETAKNTKDLSFESAKTNEKLDKLITQTSKLLKIQNNAETRRLNKSRIEKNKIAPLDKGVLRRRDFKI